MSMSILYLLFARSHFVLWPTPMWCNNRPSLLIPFELTNSFSSVVMIRTKKMRSQWRRLTGPLSAATNSLLVLSLTAVPLESHDTATGFYR